MGKKIISTGNLVGDNLLRKPLVDNVGLWALVSYFESKGLLNRDEFIDFLNVEAKMIIQSILEVEQNDQE